MYCPFMSGWHGSFTESSGHSELGMIQLAAKTHDDVRGIYQNLGEGEMFHVGRS